MYRVAQLFIDDGRHENMNRLANKATIEITGEDAEILIVSLGTRIDWSMKEQDFLEINEHELKLNNYIRMMQLLEKCQDEFHDYSGVYRDRVKKYFEKKRVA